jgi:hypothetical protein
MGQIYMAERKRARQKRIVSGIELPRHPIGPDPVQVVLDDLGVNQPSRVKHHSRTDEFDGFLNFGRLGKLP